MNKVILAVVVVLAVLVVTIKVQMAYSQAPVTELGTEVSEIDLPEYEGDEIDVDGTLKATGIQIVEVDNPILEDVQYKNYTLDLDVMTYFNCVSEESLPLYQLSDEDETGVDFRAQHSSIYIAFMEGCLRDQWILTPEGQESQQQ